MAQTNAGPISIPPAAEGESAVSGEIVEQGRVLDGLVRYGFGSNPELMGAWGSARNVPGPFRSKVIPPVEDHPTPGGIAPAA